MDDQFTTMRTPEIGRWSDQMNAKDFELAPFGRMSLGAMRSTITLADCSAAAVHLVTGRQDMRLNSGSTLPANAHEVFIRNPYSTAIKGKFFEGLPIDIGGKSHENSVHLSICPWFIVTPLVWTWTL